MCRFALGCGQSSAKGLLQIAENGGLNALFGQRRREFSAAFAIAEGPANLCEVVQGGLQAVILGLPAEQPVDVRMRPQGDGSGFTVGGLAVVDEGETVAAADAFLAVGETSKPGDAGGDGIDAQAGVPSEARCNGGVLPVVGAGELECSAADDECSGCGRRRT